MEDPWATPVAGALRPLRDPDTPELDDDEDGSARPADRSRTRHADFVSKSGSDPYSGVRRAGDDWRKNSLRKDASSVIAA